MNIWFVVVYLVAGVIGMGIIGFAVIVNVARAASEKDIYGADVIKSVNNVINVDQTDQKKEDKIIYDAVDEFVNNANDFNKSMPKFKLICRVLLGIMAWPIMVPYHLHYINKYFDELDWIVKNGRYE